MKRILILCLLPIIAVANATDSDLYSRSIDVSVGISKARFSCDSSNVGQVINISPFTGIHGKSVHLDPIRLDSDDDCSRATWMIERAEKSSARLVMVNPGRFGIGAQMLVFYIDEYEVKFSGYLPVSADTIAPGEFRVAGDDAYGKWERTDAIQDGVLKNIRELMLIESGAICLNHKNAQIFDDNCHDRKIYIRKGRPICLAYSNDVGAIVNKKFCNNLLNN